MLRRWGDWAPLTGLVSAAFGVAGAAIEIVTNPPGADASGKDVIAFYSAQGGTQQLAAVLIDIHSGVVIEVLAVVNGREFDFIDRFVNLHDGHVFRTRYLGIARLVVQKPTCRTQVC